MAITPITQINIKLHNIWISAFFGADRVCNGVSVRVALLCRR